MGFNFSKLISLGAIEATLQNNRIDVSNGVTMDVSGHSSITFQVTGTFVGTVLFRGSVDGVNYVNLPVCSSAMSDLAPFVSNPGIYLANIAGFKYVIARVDAITSGGITVFARASVISMPPVPAKKRNVELARAVSPSFSVNPGSYATLTASPIDVSSYPLQYLTIRGDAVHKFRATMQYRSNPPIPLGATTDEIVAANSGGTLLRMASDWIEAKGTSLVVYVYNDDTVAHTYDVFLYGVS